MADHDPESGAGSAPTATFRFYEELNDFLPPTRRKVAFALGLEHGDTVSTCLGRLGVPEAVVDLVLVDGEPVGLDHRLLPGERIAVYPVFESFDIATVVSGSDRPLRRVRFSLPPDLAELAERLTAAGIDTVVVGGAERECAARAENQGRVWLTRDPDLVAGVGLRRVYRVRASPPGQQVAEVLARFQLSGREMRRPS